MASASLFALNFLLEKKETSTQITIKTMCVRVYVNDAYTASYLYIFYRVLHVRLDFTCLITSMRYVRHVEYIVSIFFLYFLFGFNFNFVPFM